jgi:hypothetical protein
MCIWLGKGVDSNALQEKDGVRGRFCFDRRDRILYLIASNIKNVWAADVLFNLVLN